MFQVLPRRTRPDATIFLCVCYVFATGLHAQLSCLLRNCEIVARFYADEHSVLFCLFVQLAPGKTQFSFIVIQCFVESVAVWTLLRALHEPVIPHEVLTFFFALEDGDR